MGRSKFPGKPSKSINRKRISVLQLDPNNSGAATNTTPATSAAIATTNNATSSGATSASTAASAAASSATNTEDEDEQTKTEENVNLDSYEYEKRRNGKKEDDDDDEDDEPPRVQGGTTNGTRGINGRLASTNSNSTNQQQQQQQQNNTNSQQQQQQSDKNEISQQTKNSASKSSPSLTNASSSNLTNKPDSADSEADTAQDVTITTTTTTTATKECKKLNIPSTSPTRTPATTILNNSVVSPSSSTLAPAQLNFLPKQRPSKKFKNLNINKPEVMLPSSAKLKLQQQQQQQQETCNISSSNNNFSTLSSSSPAPALQNSSSTASSTSALNEPEEPVNNLQQQPNVNSNNELLLASSTLSSPLRSTSSSSSPTSTSSISSSINNVNNYHHKSVNHNNIANHTNENNDDVDLHNDDVDENGIIANDRVNHNNDHDVVGEFDLKSHDTSSTTLDAAVSSHIELVKSSPKSTTDSLHLNGTSEDNQNHDFKDHLQNRDDSKTSFKLNTSITPVSSPTRTMETTTNGTLNGSPSTASITTSCSTSATLAAATSTAATLSSNSNSNSSTSTTTTTASDKKQKKTVTFKNVLETSDDKSAVKKFYNPDNRKPLVSIIKKECLNRPLMYTRNSEFIVRPSRLTEILKNNSNIDKLNSLKFRTNPSASSSTLTNESSTSSVLAGPLSRVFGAPLEEEDNKQKQNIINFRLTKEQSDDEEEDDDEEDDEEEEDMDDEDEEEDELKKEGDIKAEQIIVEKPVQNGDIKDEEAHKDMGKIDPALEEKKNLKTLPPEEAEEEQQMIVDKHFVLPKRSSRSSRVIKPNKRLIEDGIICKKSSLKSLTSTTASATLSAKEEKQSSAPNQQPNYFGLGDYNAKECNGNTALKSSKDLSLDTSSSKSSTAFPSTNVFSNFGNSPSAVTSTSGTSSLKPSSFVLRQPRLQFESLSNATATPATTTTTSDRINTSSIAAAAAAAALALSASLPKSLQQVISSSSTNSGSLTASASLLSPTFSLNGTSSLKNNINKTTPPPSSSPAAASAANQCTVCSSIIHTKNLPQANKYIEPSCEYCRKFISKILKKSLAMKNSPTMKTVQLQCKAERNCALSPINQNNKTGHIKNFKKVYKERCGHCWLNKCLQTLQLPKVRLNALLSILAIAPPPPNNSKSATAAAGHDTKLRKELLAEDTTSKLINSIKWKPLVEPLTAAATSNTSAGITLPDHIKLNLKSNPLVENNVTFGSLPLLRPAILEKPLFLKSPVETKQEKLDKKPSMDILRDLKTEPIAVDTTSVVASKSKKDRKSLEKDRKEIRLKELHSPKHEDKSKDVKEKLENVSSASQQTPQQMESKADVVGNNAALVVTSCSAVTCTTVATTTSNGVAAGAAGADKRQRIDLKGPRVKHVCRSASIVLGQPLALFGEDGEETALTEEQLQQQSLEVTEQKLSLTDENDNCASCKTQQMQLPEENVTSTTTSTISSTTTTTTPNINTSTTPSISTDPPPLKTAKIENTSKAVMAVSKLSQRPHHYNTQLSTYKKQLNTQINQSLLPSRLRKEPQVKCKLMISIDFWENYDPAEVCQTGFGLIITETVAQRALCFLCGSAGQEPLIFCSCCCEPYHQYCVQDEFNLKHGSLDDTLLLNESCLSVTGLNSHTNTAIAKLNWLCPRCTVCYTCNMSSGAKVKCQKCQKNYHSTCLGTSKRLLGADRPLICVNCLKCRSCSTTKVTKFVGNLPMCTQCFKLRKKGNYCPVCQKCYDDQDFDLKMMECGDCRQWVHAKCEALTDEQYNLLSTLPESIEFICKRCSRKSQDAKQRASEWREAVKEEFKSSLMSVLKLLSKSRQACSLLKLSPRKQIKCSCGSSNNSNSSSNRYQPKALQFNTTESQSMEQDPLAIPTNIDVYEFDDREREQESLSPSRMEKQVKKCLCQPQMPAPQSHLSLVEIKNKISNGAYVSLAEFNYDMNLVIQQANCDDLVIVYKEILSEQFPWFQNETQACTDALEEDMYESSGGAYGLNSSIDSESDFNMDCLPSAQDQQDDQDRSALLAELPADLEDLLYNIKTKSDSRICLFCRRTGEGLPGEEARLLYCGHDCWVHTNCALWSAEVFEEIDGSLQNVHSAVARGRMIKCSVCGNRGATVGCNIKSCGEHYHYPCARSKNCAFLADKSMFCPGHAPSSNNSKINFETQFEVTRPVYVELERKRKKLHEPSKVQFHIGSLEVKQLGHILPRFSDTYEALVPVNFLCSRLYWSSKEPWKIVEYTVRTYIYNSSSSSLANGSIDLGKNFTVDHSQTNANHLQLQLSQIQQWHLSLSKGDYETAEEYDYLNNFPQHSSCSANNTQETSVTNEEEPQTNADLLPPEIKDAIFEDLPGDLLEGISMLDIFTKCMNYEDMAQGDHSKDGNSSQQTQQNQQALSDEDTMTSIGAFTKQLTAELNGNWSNTNNHHVEDALLTTTAAQAVKLQKLKKSCSSPSVNNCDVNTKNAIKRRKISENMLQSLNNHQRIQKKEVNTSMSRRIELEASSKRTFTWSAEKRYNLDSQQTDNKIKLMQVDGVDDSITEYRFVTQDSSHQTAVKCERCQNTYRNIESFQRHLNNCEPMSSSTSESESEHNSQTPEVLHQQPQALTLEQLQELQNKFNQQQQQRTTQNMPFIQTHIPTQSLGQLQGLQSLPLQLQSVQNLQNLQNLHNIQQLSQPQTLGGNFFISTTPQPDMNNATSDLQMYANALQGLTANLNGTFTLQPSTTQFANAAQLQQQQPQLIAVQTNADGTQQIIQLPTQQQQQPATYQTLQATNSDKKILLPVQQGKPLKTMATKAAQQAQQAKNKLKATTVVKPIQSKINVTTATTTNQHMQPQTVNATQLLNQQLIQQLQQAQAQQQQQQNQQPQILFQSAPSAQQQPQIIMQQPQNIISFVTTTNDGSQQPQLQYVTLPAAPQQTTEYKPQTTPLFTTANTQPLMQSHYLQTDAQGNLVLTQAPQATTPLQLLTAPQQPQVIGTLIQPQTLQLQGGNVITTTTTATAEGGIPQQAGAQQQQQQVIISGPNGTTTNGLDLLSAATQPQLVLATTTQPMYYGLETIVQNTVMSSQQFVSTAMPGVLSQNASFSATTTQVFQASKIEPLVDIPAGYVLLNNVDANNALLQQQQQQQATNVANTAQQQNNFIQAALQQQAQAMAEQQQQQQQQQQQAQNNVYRIQTPPVSTQQSYQLHSSQQPQILVTQATQPQQQQHIAQPQTTQQQFVDQQNIQLLSAKVQPTVNQHKRTKTTTPQATATKMQPQVVNKVMPSVVLQNAQQQQVHSLKLKQQQQPTTPNIKLNAQRAAANNVPQPAAAAAPVVTLQTNLKQQQNAQVNVATSTTTTPIPAAAATVAINSNKKTNMIRPLHKLEVKPKQIKTVNTTNNTVVTKPANNSNNIATNNNNAETIQQLQTTQINNNTNKMLVLKPQQKQQQQQQLQQTQQQQQQQLQQQQIEIINQNPIQLPEIQQEATNNIQPLTSLAETPETTEFINLQHVSNAHQQHYNVADAMLLDENSQITQQTLSHCSFSNAGNNFETSTTPAQNPGENVSNILPTIQRMPQYTNINIVNPLQQYSATSSNTTSSSSSTTSSATTITRPTNRVLPMQQRQQYEQHSQQATCTTTTQCTATSQATQFTQNTTTTTNSAQISQNNLTTHPISSPQQTIKTNINKIAYEAEVKQLMLHSPQPQHESQHSQQQHIQQQQHVMHMQQQALCQHIQTKSSPPPLTYDITDKPEDPAKLCLHDINYVQNNMPDFVDPSTQEECLITDPKFPPEGEVILGTECCNDNNDALNSLNNIAEAEEEQEDMEDINDDDEEEDDDGFSIRVPSNGGTDNLSMDSDEPAVKEKISKILDNLTNEECNDSLNTSTTLEAQVEMNCNNQYLNQQVTAENLQQLENELNANDQQMSSEEANSYYTPTTEETTAFIAAQLAVENMKEQQQQNETYLENQASNKMQVDIPDPITSNFIQQCQDALQPSNADLNNMEPQQSQQASSNTISPLTMAPTQAPQPPARDPKRISGPHLLYEIQSEDGFTYKSSSISEVWEKVFEAVQVARRANGLAPLPEGPLADMSGVQMIGLKTNALKYLIEQLPGVEKCSKYTPKYHRRSTTHASSHSSSSGSSSSSMNGNASAATSLDNDSNSMDYASDQEDLTENPFDCARCEPYSKRSEYDMFSWLASRHRKQPVQVFVQPSDNELVPRRGTGSNLPMAMKYRTLKETYKDYVGVFRSHVHGRGLYCTKDIEAGEMVIEYAGELIRSTLTDQRERYYNSRGIGCYMFKIDDHLVVDATMRGNAARFINHSCEPNCYSKVVDILGHKHIIIFALRRIVQGEELTYDYKFPFEDEKIPCSCGSKRCRKYLN